MSAAVTEAAAVREEPPRSEPYAFDMEDIDLTRIVLIIRRQIWGIMGLAATVGVLTMLLVMPIKYFYTSTATLKLETQKSNLVSIDEIYGVGGGNREHYQTQIGILGTRKLAEDVIARLNLANHPAFRKKTKSSSSGIKRFLPQVIQDLMKSSAAPKNKEEEAAKEASRIYNSFTRAIRIKKVKQSQLVYISAEFHDPKLAARVVNTMAEVYIQNDQKARLAMTRQATSWLTERLEELKKKLSESEENLQKYRDANQLVNVKGVISIAAQKMDQASTNLINAQKVLEETRSINNLVQKNKSLKSYLSEPAVLKHPLIQRTRGLEAELESKISTLKKRYGRKHPQMIAAHSELEAVRQSLTQQVYSIIDGIKKEYEVAKANAQAMKYRYQTIKNELTDINRKEHMLKTLNREVETNRNLYNMFLTRFKETDVTTDMQSVNARIVDYGVISTIPSRPNKKLIVLLAMILASIAGIFWPSSRIISTTPSRIPARWRKNLPPPSWASYPSSTKKSWPNSTSNRNGWWQGIFSRYSPRRFEPYAPTSCFWGRTN